MDFRGFLSTFNTDYLFMPAGEKALRDEVNGRQTALVTAQHAKGQITGIDLDVAIANINQTRIENLPEAERPSTVFVSSAKENLISLNPVREGLDSVLRWPFRAIPPIGWVFIVLGLMVYLELRTGIVSGLIKRKASA